MLNIEHITQGRSDSCMSACIAMVLGLEEHEVANDFHYSYKEEAMEMQEYLDVMNIDYRRCFTTERHVQPKHAYIVMVPSLNIVGGTHAIVFNITAENGCQVLDPNNGRPNKKFYVSNYGENQVYGKLERPVMGWALEAEFEWEHVEAWRDGWQQANEVKELV